VTSAAIETAPRFFAITPSRLDAVIQHNLSGSDLKVWTLVELTAKPGFPICFNLDWMKKRLELGIATIRRAIHKLLRAGVIIGRFENNRHYLAPASVAFEKQENRSNEIPRQEENRSFLISRKGQEQGNTTLPSVSPKRTLSIKEKNKLFACALSRTLTADWGIYPAVAVRLIAEHGQAKIEQAIQWANHLRESGKLKSKGWVYRCLTQGWAMPDDYHQATYKAREGIVDEKPVKTPQPQEQPKDLPLDQDQKLETIKKMLSSPLMAARNFAPKLAADWGIDLGSLGEMNTSMVAL
jgi:hypothetical protein